MTAGKKEMLEEEQKSSGSICANLHKSSAFGVSDANETAPEKPLGEWYVAIVKHQKYMMLCRDYLEKEQHDVYIASRKELHVYPNRTKRYVEKCVIPRYVFVQLDKDIEAFQLVGKCPFIDLFLPDRAKKRDTSTGRIALATISHQAMDTLRQAVANVESVEAITFTDEQLKLSGSIEAVRGKLKGIKGGYLHQAKKDYLVITLGKAGNIKVQIPIEDCIVNK